MRPPPLGVQGRPKAEAWAIYILAMHFTFSMSIVV